MSNLYRVQARAADIAAHYGCEIAPELDIPTEIRKGEPGFRANWRSNPTLSDRASAQNH